MDEQMRELHELYGKHDIKKVDVGHLNGPNVMPYSYGQCSCGKVYAWDFVNERWDVVDKRMVKQHMKHLPEYHWFMMALFKEII
jgi:hypothetical protein